MKEVYHAEGGFCGSSKQHKKVKFSGRGNEFGVVVYTIAGKILWKKVCHLCWAKAGGE